MREVFAVNVLNEESLLYFRDSTAEVLHSEWNGHITFRAPAQKKSDVAPPFRINLSPFDRVLRKTRSVALGRYQCTADDPAFRAGGGPHTCVYVAFHRSSVRMKIGTHAAEVLTPNHVSFYNVGERYTREAAGRDGDECDWLALSPAFLRETLRGIEDLDGVPDERLFAHSSCPLSPELFVAQHELFATVQNQVATLSSARVDEAVARLVVRAVAEADRFHGRTARRKPRPTCLKRREQIVEDAKAILARDYASEVSVFDLARQLHCSSAHLSRTFHAVTGSRLNAYRQDLRLRKGLVLLEESDLEIGDIALQLGFSSHSHFTSAFHRRFGINPSAYLRRRRWSIRSPRAPRAAGCPRQA